MKIFLTGMPGSGKTIAAQKIAVDKRLNFIDTDTMIEYEFNKSISDIFKEDGEEKFRKYEQSVLNKIFIKDNFIAATGGGLPCFHNNMNEMNKNGITFWLNVSVKIILQRINSSTKRPLLNGKNEYELLNYINETLQQRRKFYEQAKYIVNSENELIEIINSKLFN